MELDIVEWIKCRTFELNRLDVHFILSVEKNIFFVCLFVCSVSRWSLSESGYLIYMGVVMSIYIYIYCHFMQSHIHRVRACLAVTSHMHRLLTEWPDLLHGTVVIIIIITIITIIIIIKRMTRAPIYCTRWEHRALYNNTNNTHTHTHTRLGRGDIGTAVKKQFRNNY